MKLWLLEPKPGGYVPKYDQHRGFVVRAGSGRTARTLAAKADAGPFREAQDSVWIDADLTTCRELKADGPAEIILADFWEA